MSATADKARFYLEQSIPELQELSRKKIFTPQEITAIAKTRSDYEHKINARGSSALDYVSYATFEINVHALQKKRVKRLGVKATVHSGQRRIFFVFDRGVRKFPGDVELWMQAIEYARGQKALKKVGQMLTGCLRLHPRKWELWVYAARFAVEENGDITEARGYMQRGLRFCRSSRVMWLLNFRLEMGWIAKVHARRRILGIEGASGTDGVNIRVANEEDGDDMMMLPKVTAEDIVPAKEQEDKIDVTALETLHSTPIMSGAIPIAIFDAAMQQFDNDPALGLQFFDEAASFDNMPALDNILLHIDETLQASNSTSWQVCAVHVAITTSNLPSNDHKFPAATREMLSRISQGLASTKQRQDLAEWCQSFLTKLSERDLDPAIEQIIRSKIRSLP